MEAPERVQHRGAGRGPTSFLSCHRTSMWAPPPVGGTRVGQNVDHIDRLELAGDTDRQAFMAELVEYVEHPVLATIVGAILDEVIGPHMIALLRPQQDPLVSQSLPRLGCLCGTFSPSRCQIRSTRLSLIVQPAWRSSSAILR